MTLAAACPGRYRGPGRPGRARSRSGASAWPAPLAAVLAKAGERIVMEVVRHVLVDAPVDAAPAAAPGVGGPAITLVGRAEAVMGVDQGRAAGVRWVVGAGPQEQPVYWFRPGSSSIALHSGRYWPAPSGRVLAGQVTPRRRWPPATGPCGHPRRAGHRPRCGDACAHQTWPVLVLQRIDGPAFCHRAGSAHRRPRWARSVDRRSRALLAGAEIMVEGPIFHQDDDMRQHIVQQPACGRGRSRARAGWSGKSVIETELGLPPATASIRPAIAESCVGRGASLSGL